ncbi:hypothetical protein M569_15230 [Genlisea aurea]|uniref:Uncharacterized protein n=1 Tax=Genlisea aurea TaxID=192259 RepID=S8BY91_9LAMI|nr:hypothetical protein M569_15230 [Genlisea aurea]
MTLVFTAKIYYGGSIVKYPNDFRGYNMPPVCFYTFKSDISFTSLQEFNFLILHRVALVF